MEENILKIVDDFKNHLLIHKIENFFFEEHYPVISIKSAILKYRTTIDIFLVLFVSYFVYTIDDKNFYLIPIIAAYLVLVIVIWSDFGPINTIHLNLSHKIISVKSRNFVKAFLLTSLKINQVYNFTEINCFKIRTKSRSKADQEIYILEAEIIDKPAIVLLSFAREQDALSIQYFLSKVVGL